MNTIIDYKQTEGYDEVGFIYSNEAKPTIDNAIDIIDYNEFCYRPSMMTIEAPLCNNRIYYTPYTLRDGIYSYGEVNEISLSDNRYPCQVLQIDMCLSDFLRGLAVCPTSEFEMALAAATGCSRNSDSFFNVFYENWDKVKGGQRLSEIFKLSGDDKEVMAIIQEKGDQAYEKAYSILRGRFKDFEGEQVLITPSPSRYRYWVCRCITDPDKLKNKNYRDPVRVRRLLQETGSLEFWPTFTSSEIVNVLAEADAKLGESWTYDFAHPIYDLIQYGPSSSACLGIAREQDIWEIDRCLRDSVVAEILKEAGIIPMWSAKPLPNDENMYELIAVKDVNKNGKPLLDGEAVESARAQLSRQQGAYEVSLSMTKDGVGKWAKITGDNIGRQVAIVLDGLVLSYPVVNERIEGDFSISGGFTAEEAQDIVSVLDCGKLDVPFKIILESVCLGVKK